MRVKVILNPYANRWKAKARVTEVMEAFTAVHLQPDIAITNGPGEGERLAKTAVTEGYDAVVAAGGDGTISEIVNGLIDAAGDDPTIPFGILPIGTANDLSDMVHLPRDVRLAAQIVADMHTHAIDAARVNERYFDNNCALGMEPLVTLEHTKIKRLRGNLRYFVALVKAIVGLKAWQMQIQWDDGSFEGPVILLSVCNSARTGGLFFMAPDAVVDDGLLDFVLAPEMSKLAVLGLLPRLFNGSHVEHPKVIYGRTRRLTVHSNPGTPIHADGELIAPSLTQVDYEVLPGKITLIAPPEGIHGD